MASAAEATGPTEGVRTLPYRVVADYPHDERRFTEGLEIHNGLLYESVGRYGRSAIYINKLRSGTPVRSRALPADWFGEGLTELAGQIFLLTWREGFAVEFDSKLQEKRRFRLQGEGWGLTHMRTLAGDRLLMSDGSSHLYWLTTDELRPVGQVDVTESGRPVERLNELEYARGDIFANVWLTSRVAVIQPANGSVRAWVDLSDLVRQLEVMSGRQPAENVLNGIAYDADSGHFFVTGKCWPKIFELDIAQ